MKTTKHLTREQMEALHHVYLRCPMFGDANRNYGVTWEDVRTGQLPDWTKKDENKKQSFLSFRRSVQYGYDCIMLPWCGMWLGIEKDGYTHS